MIPKLSAFFLFSAILFIFGFTMNAYAKEGEELEPRESRTFGISPPVIELDCPPGGRVSTSVKIDNPNEKAIAVALDPVGTVPEGRDILEHRPISTLPPDHLSRHLNFEAAQVLIPGKSYKEVAIYIDVPKTLRGTQYAGIATGSLSPALLELDSSRASEYELTVGVGMQPGIGINIKCHITGTLEYHYTVEKIAMTRGKGNEPMSVVAIVKNTGNAEIQFFPILVLLDANKKVVSRLKAKRELVLVTGSTLNVEFQAPYQPIGSGKYTAIFSAPHPTLTLPPVERQVVVN